MRDSGQARLIAGRPVTVCAAAYALDHDVEEGRAAIVGKKLLLGCSEGTVEVISLKHDGKKEMPASAFVAGCQALRAADADWGRRDG